MSTPTLRPSQLEALTMKELPMAHAARATIWPAASKPETVEPSKIEVVGGYPGQIEVTVLRDGVPMARIVLSSRQTLRLKSLLSAANNDL